MSLAEGTFAHTMKEIELRDRRISRLEDDLERSEKRNKLLRDQLELAEGHYGDPHYRRVPVADHCDHGQGPRPVDKPPIVISFRACPTLTSSSLTLVTSLACCNVSNLELAAPH